MATITNPHGEAFKGCFATTHSSASSYGIPVWVDHQERPIMQVGTDNPSYRVSIDYETARLELARQIKDRRLELGLTLEWVSKASGIAYSNICRLEKGGSANIDTTLRVASVLGCELKLSK